MPANQRFEICDGAVPTPDPCGSIKAAAGERIVAFARSGKPPGNSFLMAGRAIPRRPKGPQFSIGLNDF
jgi:hypothetical protein